MTSDHYEECEDVVTNPPPWLTVATAERLESKMMTPWPISGDSLKDDSPFF